MSTAIAAIFHAVRYAVVALAALGIATAVFVYATDLYPIAVVDGSPVWKQTWKKATDTTIRYTNAKRRAQGEPNIPTRAEIERNVLTTLIEDTIIQQEGNTVIDGFGSVVGEETGKFLRGAGSDPAEIARDVYGLTVEEYRTLIVTPWVRREVLSRALAGRGITLDGWLYQMKIRKSISLYFTPYRWNGKVVE